MLASNDSTEGSFVVYPTFDAALFATEHLDEVWIIGGESIYKQALPIATHLYLTRIDKDIEDGDAFFPDVSLADWNVLIEDKRDGYTFFVLTRNSHRL